MIVSIDKDDISRLKEIFITRQECDANTNDMKGKLSNDSTELAVIKQQLKTITWILTAVGSGVITMLVKMFWEG